jgi:predicted anti-sigma-YlaC factor YlaD
MKMRCKKARKNISLAMDSRLEAVVQKELQTHLRSCPSCQSWNRQQLWLREQIKAPELIQPSPDFFAQIQKKIAKNAARPRLFPFDRAVFRPILLRAAMLLILIFAAWSGFSLSDRLDVPVAETTAAVFNQTMNLNVYADMPAESFGAVYDRLLQGEPQ